MSKLASFLSLAISSGFLQTAFAAACIQNNNVLNGLVGLDSSSNTVYATTTSGSNECSCVTARFTQTNTNTQMALSILLAAKIGGKEVRIDFLDGTNCNSAYRVYLE